MTRYPTYQEELERNPQIWLAGGDPEEDNEGIEDPNSSSAQARRSLMAAIMAAACNGQTWRQIIAHLLDSVSAAGPAFSIASWH